MSFVQRFKLLIKLVPALFAYKGKRATVAQLDIINVYLKDRVKKTCNSTHLLSEAEIMRDLGFYLNEIDKVHEAREIIQPNLNKPAPFAANKENYHD